MPFTFASDLITPTSYKLPDAPTVDINAEQLANTQSNAATFEGAKQLAQEFNDFQSQQVARRLQQNFPQFEGLQTSGAQVIADRLAGRLSSSDASASQRSSAARALGAGTNVAGTTLRDLGLKQYDAQSQGLSELPGFASTVQGVKGAPMFDFSNTFMSPQQRIGISMQNAENKWNVANLKAQMDAQPEPWMKALAGLADTSSNFGGILGSRAMSGTGFGNSGFGRSAGSNAADYANAYESGADMSSFSSGSASGVSESGYSF